MLPPWNARPIASYPDMTIADLRQAIGYVEPPPHLQLPHYHEDREGVIWKQLQQWFGEQGIEDVYGATTVYCAQLYDVDLYDAEDLVAQYEGNIEPNYN